MSTTKIPKFGDPEILPRGTVRRPSTERQPFDHSGRLKPGGPGPLTEERFTEAPDLEKIPQWTRTRGNEWTTAEFRAIVFQWLIDFFDTRVWARKWDIKEVASAVRSVGRLPEGRLHLVIGITDKDGERIETAAEFPPSAREDNPLEARAILDRTSVTFDAINAAG